MERRRLQVILEAQNRAQGPLRQFGAQIQRTMTNARRAAERAGKAMRSMGEDAQHMGAGGRIAGRGLQMLSVIAVRPLLALLTLGLTVIMSVVGALGRLASAAFAAGRAIVSGLINVLRQAIRTATRFALVLTGVLAVAFGVASTKAASFEQGMRNVNTIMRASEAQFASFSEEVLRLSTEVPQTADVLALAAYNIASAGYTDAADNIMLLRASAIAAVAGLAQTDEAAGAITKTLAAYALGAEQATRISDILFKTVERGVITFPALAQGIGQVVDSAASAGVPIEQLTAAIATMTKTLEPAMVFTSLNRIILTFLDAPKQLTTAIKAATGEMPSMIIQTRGLAGAIEVLSQVAEGNPAILAELGIEMRALRAAMSLTRNEGQEFTTHLQAMYAATGATQAAFAEQSKALRVQWDLMKSSVAALAVTIGNVFLRAIEKAVQAVGRIATRMKEWIDANPELQARIAVLGDVIETVMARAEARIGAWLDWLSENWTTVWDTVAERVAVAADFIVMWIGRIVGAIGYLVEQRQSIWDWARDFAQAMAVAGESIVTEILGRIRQLADELNVEWELPLGISVRRTPLAGQVAGGLAGAQAGAPFGPWGAAAGAVAGATIGGKAGDALTRLPQAIDGLGDRLKGFSADVGAQFDALRAQLESGQGFFGGMRGAAMERGVAYSEWLHGLREAIAGLAAGRDGDSGLGMQQLGPGVFGFGDVADSIEEATAALTVASQGVGAGGTQLVGASDSLQGAARSLGDAAGTLSDAAKSIPGYVRGAAMAERYGLMASIAEARGMPGERVGFLREQEAWQERQVWAAQEAFRDSPADIRLLQIWERAETDLKAIREALESQDRMAVDLPDWWPRADVLGVAAGVATRAAEAPVPTGFQVARPPIEWGDFPLAHERAPGDMPDWRMDRIPAPGSNPDWRLEDRPTPGDNPNWIPHELPTTANGPAVVISVGEVNSKEQMKQEADAAIDVWWGRHIEHEETYQNY